MRELRLVLLGLAALIALSLGAAFLMRAFKVPVASNEVPAAASKSPTPVTGAGVPSDPKLKTARGKIERAIADSPDYTRFFDQLRLVFPSDYAATMDRLAASAETATDVNVDSVMLEATTDLRRAHGAMMAHASDDALNKYFMLQAKEIGELEKRDPHLCVVFATGGPAAGFLGFWADHRGLIADAAIAGLDAMSSGQTDQVTRSVPSDADLQALEHALVDAGLTRPEIGTILDETPANPPIADERMCMAQVTYMTTVAAMPADARARLHAFLASAMAKS